MNVLHKTVRETMKKNRVRTLVTIAGIVLSAALFTAVMTFCSSIANYLWKTYSYEYGISHIKARWMDEEIYEKICADERTEEVWSLGALGYAQIKDANGPVPYLFVTAADANPLDEGSIRLTEGRLPQNSKEAIVPAELIAREGETYAVGSELELELGLRTGTEGIKWFVGSIFDPETQEVLGETLEPIGKTINVMITGIYESTEYKNVSNTIMGYYLITGSEGMTDEPFIRDIFIKIKNPAVNLKDFCDDMFEDGYEGLQWKYIINGEILMFSGYFKYSNIGTAILLIAALILVMVIAGSVMLIYSAFSISVGERTRQFGIFSSVGTSQKQIRAMVRYEAFAIATLGTPVGILIGIAGIWITILLLGDKIQAFQTSVYELNMHVTWWAIAAAIMLSYMNVFISAWIPSVRAGRINAIAAIRQSKDIRTGKRIVKVSKLFMKLFGAERVLARKYYGRDRKKYRATIFSLMVSMILIISTGSMNMYINRAFEGDLVGLHEYDVSVFIEAGVMTNEIMEEINQLDSVEEATFLMDNGIRAYPEEEIKADYDRIMENSSVRLVYMDDLSYQRMLEENGIREEMEQKKTDGYPGVLLNKAFYFEEETDEQGNLTRLEIEGKFLMEDAVGEDVLRMDVWSSDTGKFDELFSEEEGKELRRYDLIVNDDGERVIRHTFVSAEDGSEYYKDFAPDTIEIGAFISRYPFGMDKSQREMRVIYPLSQCPDSKMYGFLYFKAPESTRALEDVTRIMEANGYTPDRFSDYQQEEKVGRDTVTVIKIFSWGLLILISLIGAANVFNTVTSNMMLRRRDFAMLSSVGMEVRQRNKMLRFECLTFIVKACIYSVVPTAGALWIVKRIFGNLQEGTIMIPWTMIGYMVIGIVVIVYLSLGYAAGKMKQEEMLENLRREAV